MSNDELKKYIKTMLGESFVDVELEDTDIDNIVKQTLDKVAPFYDGRRYILGQGKIINLSDHPGIKEIVNVYNTKHENIFNLQDYVFGGSGIMIYSANLIDKLKTYVCYQMMYNEFQNLKGINFKWMKPNLYLDGYEDEVIMAAGAFIQGSSIELSADAPIRPPYNVYFQGGLTFDHSKMGTLKAVEYIKKLNK